MAYKLLNRCVCCDNSDLKLALDLGSQPLANNLKIHSPSYPLAVNLCENCWHLQLTVAVDPQEMFSEYLYVSGTTKTLRDYFSWFAKFAMELKPDAQHVLDIACNDGSQLDAFNFQGLQTYGVDPAKNLHALSSVRHRVLCQFMDHSVQHHFVNQKFDIIVAQNVIAHTADPGMIFSAAADLLKDDGVFLVQTSQADMVSNGEFDTIYHEHISFFSLSSMSALAQRCGLAVVDAIKTPVHGHSWLFVIGKQQTSSHRLSNAMAMQQSHGLMSTDAYQHWATRCRSIQQETKNLIAAIRAQGQQLIGYGAAAKGMTFLNSIDESLDAIIDDNPLKQGFVCPGNGTPIVSPDLLSKLGTEPVVFVPLAWNFFDEIRGRIQHSRENHNDRYLRYFPEVQLVS